MFTKKRFGLILGLVALALTAVPAVASANTLTNELGAHVPPETTVEGTSTNATTVTSVGSLFCKHVKINGIVTDSGESSGTVHIAMDGAKDTAIECHRTTPTTTEANVSVTPTFETLHLETGGTNTATFSYLVHFPGLGGLTCQFGGTVAASVTGTGGLQASGAIGGTSPEPCPKGGNFSGTFSLSSPEFGPLTLD
ncbi:MAG TPA: hypothetical protein VF255_01935 [Solirubrobacterales bacterium]